MIVLLIVLLGQIVFLFLWPGHADYYRLSCSLLSLILTSWIALWWSRRSTVEEPEGSIIPPDEEALVGLELASSLLRGVALSVVVFCVTLSLSWVGVQSGLNRYFYDPEFRELTHDIAVLERAESYQAAIELIAQRLERPLSREKQVILATHQRDDLIALGRKATRWEDKLHFFYLAKEVAERWGIDATLPDAEARAAHPTLTPLPAPTPLPTVTPQPTPSPYPTQTPYPTPTERPTQTPQPTYTPLPLPPTWTPYPTPPPTATPWPTPTSPPVPQRPPLDFSKCHEVTVAERLGIPGTFHAWECGSWGWYGQWQPSKEAHPVGGPLPQVYVHGGKSFYLCPPKKGEPRPYTAYNCEQP